MALLGWLGATPFVWPPLLQPMTVTGP